MAAPGPGRGVKNIAVFADGTWQRRKPRSDDDVETGVAKLYEAAKAMQERDPSRQVCFYDAGVGTGRNWLTRLWEGLTGAGLEHNIKQCYDFIRANYEPGDRVFLFGFSRGAYTVRSVIGMLRKVGLLRHDADFHRAYRFYRSDERPDSPTAKAFRAENARLQVAAGRGKKADARPLTNVSGDEGHLLPVWFVGAWDTVGSYGIPGWRTSRILHSFRDRELSGIVRTARHALAIDERRNHFVPTLWEETDKPGQSVEQRWFAGTHSGVGGGSLPAGLADVALQWMRREAEAQGLLVDGALLDDRIKPDPMARLVGNAWYWRLVGTLRWRRMFHPRYLPQDVDASAWQRLDKAELRYRPRNLRKHLERRPAP